MSALLAGHEVAGDELTYLLQNNTLGCLCVLVI